MLKTLSALQSLNTKSFYLLLLIVVNVGSAKAELSSESSWYQIEYIIFQHLKTDAHVLRYEDTPYPKNNTKDYSYLTNNPTPISTNQYTRLSLSSMKLADAVKHLKRRRDIKLLDYAAWVQPLIANTTPPPLKISYEISEKTSLFGELQIKRSRFTHAEFELFMADRVYFKHRNIKNWLLSAQPMFSVVNILSPIQQPLALNESNELAEVFFNIHYLRESRRIKQDEIHYLDHPVLGVIVTISPVEAPAYSEANQVINFNVPQ